MGAKLFVSHLSLHSTADDLRELFGETGFDVREVALITDPRTGISLGFAIVELGSARETGSAVAALDGRTVRGRTIRVRRAESATGSRHAP